VATSEHADKVDAAVAEMLRKPDAQMALELIEQLATTDPHTRRIINAYFEGWESD